MWNHVICSDENEKSEDAAEDSHPMATPTLDGNNELRIIQPTSSSSPTSIPFYLVSFQRDPRKVINQGCPDRTENFPTIDR